MCMCTFEGCAGTGVMYCSPPCGGDQCICVCGGERECPGCDACASGDPAAPAAEDESSDDIRIVLADPTGQIERECADTAMRQRDVALTYALALRDAGVVPVDWKRANEAIRKRWPNGLERVKKAAWKQLSSMGGTPS